MLNCSPCPGHFADHPVEDIIEKIACQFTARHIRGRPRPPYWFLGFPLYVCDSRYNDRDRVFVKIKNWNSCIPEEVRKSTEFMPIYPFERTVYPIRYPSPFLIKGSKVKGPGGIIPSLEDIPNERKIMSARKVSGGNDSGPSKGQYIGPTTMMTKTMTATMVQNALSGSIAPIPQQQQLQMVAQSIRPPVLDRSLIAAAGGLSQGNNIQVEKLSPETSKFPYLYPSNFLLISFLCQAKHFDRDPYTNEMLWFSGPPINVVRPPSARHSSTYLHFLAMKRKRKQENENENEQGQERGEFSLMNGTSTTDGDEHYQHQLRDGVIVSSNKRLKVQREQAWPTVREMTNKLWVDMGLDN